MKIKINFFYCFLFLCNYFVLDKGIKKMSELRLRKAAPVFFFIIQFTLFSSAIFSQKAWDEDFSVFQLSQVSKGKFNGYFQLDNYTKKEKKSLEKAKLQIIHRLIFSGVGENTNLHLELIKPIPFIDTSALKVKDGESAIFKFIELQGQAAIVSIVLSHKTPSNDYTPEKTSWFIDVDMKKLVDLLESAQLKKSLNEIFGVKLKAIYCPKDLNEVVKILYESADVNMAATSSRSRYTEEFNLLKTEYGDQFEWLSLTDYAKDITFSIKENEKTKLESLIQIIINTLKADVVVQFYSRKLTSGMMECNLIYLDAFDLREFTFTKYRTLAGGLNQSSLLAGYLQNSSNSFDDVIQQSNTIYSRLLEEASRARDYDVMISIQERLHKNLNDSIVIGNKKNKTIQQMIEKIMSSYAYRSAFDSQDGRIKNKKPNSHFYRYAHASPKLMRYDLNFQTALNQKMKSSTGFQFDFVFIGNNQVLMLLTDLTKEERKIKMTQEFEKIQSSNAKKDFEDFLTEYPEFDRISEVKSLLKKIVDNEYYSDYQAAKSVNTFEGFRSFLIKYKQIDKSSDTIYSKVVDICNEMFLNLVASNALQTNDYLKILNENFISGDEIILLIDKLYESVLPSNWKTINSLVEINKAISDLHVFLKNTFSKDRPDLLNHDVFTKLSLTTYEIVNQFWTNQNLKVGHFLNGDSIPEARTEEDWARAGRDKKPAWGYFNNDAANEGIGKFYNWYALSDPRGIVPKGYRIPTLNDYLKLAQNCGGVQIAGEKLKCPTSWGDDENYEAAEFSYFGIVPYGFHTERGFLSGEEIAAFWTTTSKNDNNANYIYFMKGKKDMNTTNEASKAVGLPIRVIKDDIKEEENNYSEIMKSLELKRNELLLKEYGLLKKYEDVQPFLRRQVTKELELPESCMKDIDAENLNTLFNRFFKNDKVIKNGVYLSYQGIYEESVCVLGYGEGLGVIQEDKIGFVNNVQNYILYEDAMNYKGEIKNGSANGKGVLVMLEDNLNGFGVAGRYEGMFEDNYLINGKITFKNKNVYTGQCQGNVPNGSGKMILASGKIEQGTFVNGEFQIPFICKKVTIGNQVWMSENLNVAKFKNGELIPQIKTLGEWQKASSNNSPAWCYYDFNPANGVKYGKLYNWYAVNDSRGLAPAGWHVPNENEFDRLINVFGDEKSSIVLKSKTGWVDQVYGTRNESGNNESGFTGLPGGELGLDNNYYFTGKGYSTHLWTSECCKAFDSSASYFFLSVYGCGTLDNNNKGRGHYIRLVKD